ncbi:unnamed protein product [Protopolystoma xenopodis]|uniref:Uncharacterized protein n=1 Tax=Protopolystoma xenopodis TaxID=117903 RepID=A0A3S5BR79_9PLAT|nr:unnamed protein product [Protopolystoma xenopodis]
MEVVRQKTRRQTEPHAVWNIVTQTAALFCPTRTRRRLFIRTRSDLASLPPSDRQLSSLSDPRPASLPNRGGGRNTFSHMYSSDSGRPCRIGIR